jgi:hypothetical protein
MEGIAPHPKYPKTQVRPPMPWFALIQRLDRRCLVLIGALGIVGTGLGLWFVGVKQSPPDSDVLDLTGGVRTAIHRPADGHRQTERSRKTPNGRRCHAAVLSWLLFPASWLTLGGITISQDETVFVRGLPLGL